MHDKIERYICNTHYHYLIPMYFCLLVRTTSHYHRQVPIQNTSIRSLMNNDSLVINHYFTSHHLITTNKILITRSFRYDIS